MKKFLFIILCFVTLQAPAQKYNEFGIFLGGASYKGELNDNFFRPAIWNPALGITFRRTFSNHWSARLNLTAGMVEGRDSLNEDPFAIHRNLSFRSRVIEASGMIEFNFFPYETGHPTKKFTPFLFTGFAAFNFNPQANFNDDWYDLQPMGTEGQDSPNYPTREKYKKLSYAIPLGGGVKWSLSRRIGVSLEMGVRTTYTDYLDDVSTTYVDRSIIAAEKGPVAAALSDRSLDPPGENYLGKQRGNSKDVDKYMFAGFTLLFRLGDLNKIDCDKYQ